MAVIIAGGGIVGLTLALSLHEVGISCQVFEQTRELKPLGVGINVLPHAVRELTELGLHDKLAATAISTRELGYYSKRGQKIWTEPRGLSAGYNWPQFSIFRGDLQMILLDAVRDRLGPNAVRSGCCLSDFEVRENDVTATFTDRNSGKTVETVTGNILVGADGIHSAMRKKFYPQEGAPIWNGAILWRGVTRGQPFLDGQTMIMAGHEHQKFVCYPISSEAKDRGNSVINWIAELKVDPNEAWAPEDWNRKGVLDDFLPRFEDWDFGWLNVPDIIRTASQIYEFPMVDRDPLPRWTHGRATLIGDAAHAMYPIGSNGATQGIIDARVLTRELVSKGICQAALLSYEDERRPITARIVELNRQNGPEQVMQAVEEKASGGFDRIEDVLSTQELNDTAMKYKKMAGFEQTVLNERASIVSG